MKDPIQTKSLAVSNKGVAAV